MAIAVAKTQLFVRPPLLLCANQSRRRSYAALAVETLDDRRSDQPSSPQINTKKWTTTNLKELGIHISIPKPVKSILNGLRKKGYEVYLVGGCVRDVMMKRTPKDFDILTTAELREALFSNLDSHLVPDRPCHNSLWIALLAFHEALVQKPRDALVVAAFIFALSNGGDLAEAVKIARAKARPPDVSFQELLQPQEWCTDRELVNAVLDLASLVRTALRSMTRYPQASFSDLVFIPPQVYLSTCRVFECVGGKTKENGYDRRRRRHKLNYSNLALGSLPDVRFAFSQVILDTLYPPKLKDDSSEDMPEGLLPS